MKISTPSRKVASMAPVRVWTCLTAQRPKAAEPPAALTSATMMPSRTRNMKMPAFQPSAMAPMKPSEIMVSRESTRLKPPTNSEPTTMPMNRDE